MIINTDVLQHDSDKAALEALKSIPGFTPFLKAFMKVWNERQFKLLNMSSRLRINDKQMSKYYDMLPPICDKLGIKVPELYLVLDPEANAWTSGDTDPFIVMTSGLLETLPERLIPTVLAHECGHIACHHVLYSTMGQIIVNGIGGAANNMQLVTAPLEMAFAYWMRCSEFSADRAAMICDGSADNITEMCMCFAGFDKDILAEANVDEFLSQAEEYEKTVNDSKWNKTLEFAMFSNIDHPLAAVRALEGKKWGETEQFGKTVNYFEKAVASNKDNVNQVQDIPVKDSARYYIGMDSEEVQSILTEQGYINVSLVKTTEKGLLTRNRQTMKIQINGDDAFKEETWFPKDASIVITYYEPATPEEIAAAHVGKTQTPDASKRYIGRDCLEVMNELQDAGFTEVLLEKQETIKHVSKPNSIVKISIAGQTQFSKGDWFDTQAKIRIIYAI